MVPLITKSAPNCYVDTPFTDVIALVEMPKKFIFLSMNMYDGITDPENHIAQYKRRMFTTSMEIEYREASMCKGFGSSLTVPALQWFMNLSNTSTDSFTSLTDHFVDQFASSMNLEKTADYPYEVIRTRHPPTWIIRSCTNSYGVMMEASPNLIDIWGDLMSIVPTYCNCLSHNIHINSCITKRV